MKRRSGYISTGRLQNACSYYEKVLQLQPTDKGVEGKLEKLRREREQVEEIPRGEEAQDTGGISIGRRTSLGMGENIEAFLCYFFPCLVSLPRPPFGKREHIRQISHHSIPAPICGHFCNVEVSGNNSFYNRKRVVQFYHPRIAWRYLPPAYVGSFGRAGIQDTLDRGFG